MRLYKAFVFFQKDYLIDSSYKLAFILGALGALFPVLNYFFIGELMEGKNYDSLNQYGGNYFHFALLGLGFSNYFIVAQRSFAESMRRAQMEGCLEAILSSQTDSKSIVFYSSLYSFISSGIMIIIMFLISIIFLNFDLSKANFFSFFIALLLSLISFISLGIICAAGTIIFKKREPFGFIFGTIGSLLGGAFFPVTILPEYLQKLSFIFPLTHSLKAIRLSLLQGYSISMLSHELLLLLISCVILLPLSLFYFQYSVEKGKSDGTLMQF